MEYIIKQNSTHTLIYRLRYVCVFFLMLLLASCASTKKGGKGDGAPEFYVDETQVQNPVPRKEPLAKYGNMRSYVVFGKRYYTMKSSKNYSEIGTASWYGTKFHAHKTSSGEPYDLCGMTAAHKTLPLPTYCEVTNLKNHKTIIVKVNDRGPFESKRIIDLSYVAAKKLGMAGHGTAMVKVTAIDPDTYGKPMEFAEHRQRQVQRLPHVRTHEFADAAPKHRAAPLKHYAPTTTAHGKIVYLQVGAFRDRTRAEKLKQKLVAMLEAPVTVSKGKLYKVQVGPIRDVATADHISSRLKRIGLSASRR